MARYILRYTGTGPTPAADVATIKARAGINVLDQSGRMLLVEAADDVAGKLAKELTNWAADPEVTYPLPDTRKKPVRAPEGE
jgi:hypothetical protein